jgi:hypothetical protein
MAEGKNSFVLYTDQDELWDEVSDEQAGKLIKHIFKYVSDKNPEPPDQITKLLFIPIKQTLKRDLRKYKHRMEGKSNAAVLGNLKRWQPDLYQQYSEEKITLEEALNIAKHRKTSQCDNPVAKIADSVTVSESVSESVTVSDNNINNKTNKQKPETKVSDNEDFKAEGLNELKKPKKQTLPKVAQKGFSEEVYNCYENCLNFFPEHLHPNGKLEQGWLETIEKLNRIEKIPFDVISEITQKTREDDFWAKNFLTMNKLRQKNKDGIMYVVVFNEKARPIKQIKVDKRSLAAANNAKGWV